MPGNGGGYLPPWEHGRLAARAWVRPPMDLRCTWRVPRPGIQHSASGGGCPVPGRPAPKSRWPPGQPAGRPAGAGELPPWQVRGRQRMLRHRCPAAAVLRLARRAHARDVGGRPAGVGGPADAVPGPSIAAGPPKTISRTTAGVTRAASRTSGTCPRQTGSRFPTRPRNLGKYGLACGTPCAGWPEERASQSSARTAAPRTEPEPRYGPPAASASSPASPAARLSGRWHTSSDTSSCATPLPTRRVPPRPAARENGKPRQTP